MSNKADARIVIDRLLRDADWDIEHKEQVSTKAALSRVYVPAVGERSRGEGRITRESSAQFQTTRPQLA